MTRNRAYNALALGLIVVAAGAIVVRNLNARAHGELTLLNVSYDPTRELYAKLNPQFSAEYEKRTGKRVQVNQAHGGSSRQARAVIAGDLTPDVVTLGLFSDVQALSKRGLVGSDWINRLPNHSQPYHSTIVFVVRAGNPHAIHDWPDLIKDGVEVITPDPRSSGNGKLAVLGAWGSILARGGSESEAKTYLKTLFEHAPFLESGARGAATAFAIEKLGDVHLTWENEALRETAEAKGALEIVYPPLSILAEPYVAWVDSNVAKHQTEAPARAYLEFLFSDPAQEVIAQSGYRPFKAETLARHADRFPRLRLFPVTDIAKDWEDAQQKFFADNGIIDTVYKPKPR
ncbi:MAG: sulfate ABC transporter substrate-binding protein [Polyangiales bacterium]